jgi:hypothetical protein
MPTGLIEPEPDYSQYAFHSMLAQRRPFIEGHHFPIRNGDGNYSLFEEAVSPSVTATIIGPPFSDYERSEFAAPRPTKGYMWERPKDPMCSGQYGVNLTKFKFHRSPSLDLCLLR